MYPHTQPVLITKDQLWEAKQIPRREKHVSGRSIIGISDKQIGERNGNGILVIKGRCGGLAIDHEIVCGHQPEEEGITMGCSIYLTTSQKLGMKMSIFPCYNEL